jgi:8 Dehydrogenases with different specificities (re lated to short-chain alcohol dehydrogenases)
MNDLLSLEGKVALVTGAGQGVGEQIARHFAGHGAAAVIVNDYFAERAQAVAQSIRDAGGNAFAVQADVSDADSVRRMVAQARELAGPIDVLVNNAGNHGATPSPDVRKPFWEHGREA